MAGLFDDLKVSGATNETDSGEAGLFGDLKPRKEQNSSTLGDLGTDLKRGVQKLPSVATGLVDVAAGALTNRRFADDAADKAGELTGFQPSKWADEAREEYSPERQAAEAEINDAWKDGTATDVAGAYITNPAVIAGRVAESAPQMLAGGLVGRGALVAGRAAGVIGAPATAAQAASQAAAAGALGEGAVVAGSTMNQIDEQVEPQRAAAAALGAGVGTALLGRAGAAVAQRLGLADVESAIAGGIQRTTAEAPSLGTRLAGGAAAEGLLEELPQSVQEQMWQNFAENKALMEGTGRAAVEGALAGGVMGAGVNVLPARKPSEQMGIDPNVGPLSAAAATAVDGGPAGTLRPVADAVRQDEQGLRLPGGISRFRDCTRGRR